MEVIAYKVKIEPMREGGFMVTVPKLPGCITWGHTYEEAAAMAREAIEGFVEALAKAGEPIPVEEKRERGGYITMLVNAPMPA